MPKFKLGNVLSRVIMGEASQKEDDPGYLCASFGRYIGDSRGRAADVEDDDDGHSMISISTMGTVDNQPGTGRSIDMYIYQPMGRRIERLAMKFTIASLHPARIAQYIETDHAFYFSYFRDWLTLNDVIANFCHEGRNRPTVVAGIEGLVKQTQSSSIDRSASALAALVRVSLTYHRRYFSVNISRIETIFHLETLAGSLPCSHPDKKWFLLLVKLAKEIIITAKEPCIEKFFDPVLGKDVWQIRPSPKTAQNLRRRLIQALKVYRLYGLDSLEGTVGEACAICSVAVSTCIDTYAQGDAYMHIVETLYFTVIFILRSIHELVDLARILANRHIYMILRTIACWVDAVVYRCFYHSTVQRGRFDMDLLTNNITLGSLALVYVLVKDDDTEHMLLPESYKFVCDIRVLNKTALPRRYREEPTWCEEVPPIQSLFGAAKQRTRRLLRSFSELEREVWGCASQNNSFTSQAKIDADPFWTFLDDFGEVWWKHWRCSLSRARRVQVSGNNVTEEFREARRIGLECDPTDGNKWQDYFNKTNWAYYELHRLSRHKWGQYLRSNMDWDWDLGSCMKRLFRIEKQTRVGPSPDMQTPPSSSSGIDVDAGTEGTLKISMGEAQGILPREVKIAYKTATGETQYLTFGPLSPIPGNTSVSERPCIAEPSADNRSQKAIFEGQQEIDDSEAGTSTPDISFLKASEDSAVEETCNDCEGKDIEVQARGDTISICSLD